MSPRVLNRNFSLLSISDKFQYRIKKYTQVHHITAIKSGENFLQIVKTLQKRVERAQILPFQISSPFVAVRLVCLSIVDEYGCLGIQMGGDRTGMMCREY